METFAYRNILVATDYSDLSENAVVTASAICRKQKATLTLLHVVKDAPEYTPMAEFHPAQNYTAEMKQAAKAQLHHLGDRIREEFSIPVDEIVAYGEVVKQIVKTIETVHPDLVVIGTHGASGVRQFFIGSTAYRVIKHTRFPVLTVPGKGDWTTFRNILFPIRLVPDALKKYDIARPMIRTDDPFIHILGLSMESDPESVHGVFDLEEEMESRLTEDRVKFDVSFQRCHNYADKILEVAGKRHPDLIMIIATIDRSKGEFFIGPFSQQILNHATVPVLCVRTA